MILTGDLGNLDAAFRGWRVLGGKLISPEGWEATAGDILSIPLLRAQITAYQAKQRMRIYVAGGEGFLSVVQQADAEHYTDMGKFPTAIGARTGVWYEKRDRIYIAAPPSGNLGARVLVFEAQTD